jgi:hypothetical protein
MIDGGHVYPLRALSSPQDKRERETFSLDRRHAWIAPSVRSLVTIPYARWGVTTHYLADWQARKHDIEMSVEQWNRMVEAFDVEALAAQIDSVGAGYHILTIGQNSAYYLTFQRNVRPAGQSTPQGFWVIGRPSSWRENPGYRQTPEPGAVLSPSGF